jgi:hypothetical protein
VNAARRSPSAGFLLARVKHPISLSGSPEAALQATPVAFVIVFRCSFDCFSLFLGEPSFISNINWLCCISGRFRLVNRLYFF